MKQETFCLSCCHREETGALSGDEASRTHGGNRIAKRSESPNSFLDQESRQREEEEPVYCTTPTYGTNLGPRENRGIQTHSRTLHNHENLFSRRDEALRENL